MKTESINKNGIEYTQLTPDKGCILVDTRTNRMYSEVVCNPNDAKYFTEKTIKE